MMQKILRASGMVVLSVFLCCQHGAAASIARLVPNDPATVGTHPDYLKASVFVNLTPREFSRASGTKLNFVQKAYFKMIQRQLRRDLKKNPDLLITDYYDTKKGKFKFDALWFVIGSIIGPLGVLLSYTSPLRKGSLTTKKDRITSAWLGFAFFILWFGYLFIF